MKDKREFDSLKISLCDEMFFFPGKYGLNLHIVSYELYLLLGPAPCCGFILQFTALIFNLLFNVLSFFRL